MEEILQVYSLVSMGSKQHVYLGSLKDQSNVSKYPRQCIVKYISTSQANGSREFDAIQILTKNYENSLKYFASGIKDNQRVILMEYCQEGTMHDVIINQTRTTEQKVLLTLYEILYQVKILHDNFYAHNDIKPLNVFYSNKLPKLGDFTDVSFVMPNEVNNQRRIQGTPNYLPLNIRNEYRRLVQLGQPYYYTYNPYKKDIWCLGKCIFEFAISSVNSFLDEMTADQINANIEREFNRLGYSEMFKIIVKGMLNLNEDDRFGTDFVFQLVENMLGLTFYRGQNVCQDCIVRNDRLQKCSCYRMLCENCKRGHQMYLGQDRDCPPLPKVQ